MQTSNNLKNKKVAGGIYSRVIFIIGPAAAQIIPAISKQTCAIIVLLDSNFLDTSLFYINTLKNSMVSLITN